VGSVGRITAAPNSSEPKSPVVTGTGLVRTVIFQVAFPDPSLSGEPANSNSSQVREARNAARPPYFSRTDSALHPFARITRFHEDDRSGNQAGSQVYKMHPTFDEHIERVLFRVKSSSCFRPRLLGPAPRLGIIELCEKRSAHSPDYVYQRFEFLPRRTSFAAPRIHTIAGLPFFFLAGRSNPP